MVDKTNNKKIDPLKIIEKYYDKESVTFKYLVTHSKKVTSKALKIANNLVKNHNLILDLKFIEEAAMLHDIGVKFCDVPSIGCNGREKYIKHGVLGSRLLKKEGLLKHAFVCERHIGTGLTKEEIIKNGFSLPKKNTLPISIEEKIICLADCFYSKKPELVNKELSLEQIRERLKKNGSASVDRFNKLLKELSYNKK